MTASFPTTVPTSAELKVLINNLATLLDGAIDDVMTTIVVDDTSDFPTSGYFTVDSEIIYYGGITATSFTSCVRGRDGTVNVAHSNNAVVNQFYVADHHNHMAEELIAVCQNLSDRIGLHATRIILQDYLNANTKKISGLAAGTTNGDAVRYEQILAWALDSAVVHNTGTENVAGAKTFTTQLIGKGTTTNDSAAAGYIGEYITSNSGIVSSPSTGTYGDMTSIELTAGDWEITGMIAYVLNTGTGVGYGITGISTSSGNSFADLSYGNNGSIIAAPTASVYSNLTVAPFAVKLASTTTYYLKMLSTYTGGQTQFQGRISARRMR